MRQHAIAAFVSALLLILAAQSVTALHAAEPWSPAQPSSPLELARHFRSLTAGGPFNPGRSLSEPGTLGPEQSAEATPPALLRDPDL